MSSQTSIPAGLQTRLSDLTFSQMPQALYWVDARGAILMVNPAAARSLGYTMDELRGKRLSDDAPEFFSVDWAGFWSALREANTLTLETTQRLKNGTRREVSLTASLFSGDGEDYALLFVRDLAEEKQQARRIQTIFENTSAVTGSDYFRELAKHITAALNVRFSMVVCCSKTDGTTLRTLAYTDRDGLRENIEYEKKGTPCEIVMEGREVFWPDKLEETFPKEKGIRSWIAVPVYSPSTGKVIGNLAAFDTEPMTSDQDQTAVLKIFAARAGSEMERISAEDRLREILESENMQLQQRLRESEQRFRDLFEEAPIAYVNETLDSRFIDANRAALRILGIGREDVAATFGKDLVPSTPEAKRRVKEVLEALGKGTDTNGVILELRRPADGKNIWIKWWSNPDAGGQFTRTMFLDITEQIRLEQEQLRLKAQNEYLQEEIKLSYNFQDIVSCSQKFQKVLQQIEQVASTDATVLILGESGTGKELIARAVHQISNRSKKPLVKINCATLPANLIESELFGHEKGAFTGAMERKIGRFELADSGTIFLDEIGELPVELQAKLLRVLQEGEFERLGNPRTMRVNVRVIAATNRNLLQAIEKKEFREDLYYRINVFPITSPPLRDRKEDIPLLVRHFCNKHEGRIGRKITGIDPAVTEALMVYDWPGNIRELENLIERAMIINRGQVLEPGEWLPARPGLPPHIIETGQKLEDVEKQHIISMLQKTNWRISGEKGAAKLLGLNATTLEAKMKKLMISRTQ